MIIEFLWYYISVKDVQNLLLTFENFYHLNLIKHIYRFLFALNKNLKLTIAKLVCVCVRVCMWGVIFYQYYGWYVYQTCENSSKTE